MVKEIGSVENGGARVGVIILTYNRLSLLKITLCKVLAQTHRPHEILVVDNYSTDGTKEYLETLDTITTIYLEENTGPAGGFFEGVKYFAENSSVDFVWMMDDDFFPFDSCLEILVKNTNRDTVVFPFVREKDFASRRQPGWWGVLVPMPIINHVGYPRKDLFFWSEDTEFLQARIEQKFKYPLKWISSAKGVHFTKRETNYRQPWRYYYEIRNSTYSRLFIKERTALRMYKIVRSWVKLFGSIIVKENNKFEKMKFFLLGSYHGLTKQLGKTVEPKTGKIIKKK
ncbi:glycosyltransferase family 2 protein [Salinimicrobium terrae]|uniref:glycosyltransferase family 2 protein n=1 Tax=Salinimicrobium terrae TaxID=470866 RepID=UPI0003F600EA|nr:glycosyltransferase family 2 protein [Salinimicrobium terrae]